MAITIETTIVRRMGLAGDITSLPALPIGSLFWAYDSGVIYKTYDGTHWAVYTSGGGGSGIDQITETLTNGSSYTLPAGPGMALVLWGGVDSCAIRWTAAGAVSISWCDDNTPLTVTTDTAGKFCVLAGTPPTLKNRSGSTVIVYIVPIGA